MSALSDVRDAIARAVDPEAGGPARVGAITLRPHQVTAASRVRAALDAFGGALLADAPGLGKTYVALAVAGAYPRTLVAAPAALRDMWRVSGAEAGVPCEFISLEALSRGSTAVRAPLVIVDEAHRVANTSARRYARVAALAHHAHILLLTATPVRNRRAEWQALLGLFLGADVDLDDASLVARCVIRREAGFTAGVPRVEPAPPMTRRGDATIATALRSLPPPLALADGAAAAGLVATGLARAWSSSHAALQAALTRRLQRGSALADVLASGRLPSRADLRAWLLGDDAMQLAFPFLAREVTVVSVPACRDALERHVHAIAALREHVRPHVARDTEWRARKLRDVRARHSGDVVIAFTAFDATARALFLALRREPGVALLTGRGAETAGGPVHRNDVLDALSVRRSPVCRVDGRIFDIRLLIATDLLSEGANLQRASVIVHLDDPWTPAGVEQRVGRAARLGSHHETVFVHRFAPPPAARPLLSLERLHQAKRSASRRALAAGNASERLRGAVAGWRVKDGNGDGAGHACAVTAACAGARDAFLAVIHVGGRDARAVGGSRTARGNWMVSDDCSRVERLVRAARNDERPRPQSLEVSAITRAIQRWARLGIARGHAGLGRVASRARRRVIGRLNRVLSECGAARLASIASRVARIRADLAGARGAHVDRLLDDALAQPFDDRWLGVAEEVLADASQGGHDPLSDVGHDPGHDPGHDADAGGNDSEARVEVVALLVLRRENAPRERVADAGGATGAAWPAPAPCPPSASTGNAVPR